MTKLIKRMEIHDVNWIVNHLDTQLSNVENDQTYIKLLLDGANLSILPIATLNDDGTYEFKSFLSKLAALKNFLDGSLTINHNDVELNSKSISKSTLRNIRHMQMPIEVFENLNDEQIVDLVTIQRDVLTGIGSICENIPMDMDTIIVDEPSMVDYPQFDDTTLINEILNHNLFSDNKIMDKAIVLQLMMLSSGNSTMESSQKNVNEYESNNDKPNILPIIEYMSGAFDGTERYLTQKSHLLAVFAVCVQSLENKLDPMLLKNKFDEFYLDESEDYKKGYKGGGSNAKSKINKRINALKVCLA
jgi:hypothetical protein